MRRIILLVLLFLVILFLIVFLAVNWNAAFHLNFGFGSRGADVPVVVWTLGAFVAGLLCMGAVWLASLWKKSRKDKPADKQEML